MNKLNKIWKINILAMVLCAVVALALIIFPHTHPAELLVMSHQDLVTIVHQMPYIGLVIMLIAWVFWLKAFDAAFHGVRALDSADEEVAEKNMSGQFKPNALRNNRKGSEG